MGQRFLTGSPAAPENDFLFFLWVDLGGMRTFSSSATVYSGSANREAGMTGAGQEFLLCFNRGNIIWVETWQHKTGNSTNPPSNQQTMAKLYSWSPVDSRWMTLHGLATRAAVKTPWSYPKRSPYDCTKAMVVVLVVSSSWRSIIYAGGVSELLFHSSTS